jgi:hypothetical protein
MAAGTASAGGRGPKGGRKAQNLLGSEAAQDAGRCGAFATPRRLTIEHPERGLNLQSTASGSFYCLRVKTSPRGGSAVRKVAIELREQFPSGVNDGFHSEQNKSSEMNE